MRAAVLSIIASISIATASRADEAAETAWARMPEILARIVPPVFPVRDFDITAFGAKPLGSGNSTQAFAAAIRECVKAGGGRVVVPAGKFLSGPIHLESNVELHLSAGAEIVFSDRFEDYLPPVRVRVGGIDLHNYSPLIYAKDCVNVAITGKGMLNGNAKAWWVWKGKETVDHFAMGAKGLPVEERVFGTPEAAIRPSFVCLMNCRNILLEDFTIGSGPNWTIHPVYSENLTIRGVKVDTEGPNNDGIDVDSCRDVLIENCTFNTRDDCVVLKSGYNEDGWRVGRPTENVILRHCTTRNGHGGLVIGSEMSGDVRNVFMHDCVFDGTQRVIRIKSRHDRGGVVEGIFARDIKAENIKNECIILNMDYHADPNQVDSDKAPVYRNMRFERMSGKGAPLAVRIHGMPDSPVENIRFADFELAAKRGVVGEFISGLKFENIRLTTSGGPSFDLKSATDITLRNVTTRPAESVFLKLAGAISSKVVIEGGSGARSQIVLAKEVEAGAVTWRTPAAGSGDP